jgi:hypothetical protein
MTVKLSAFPFFLNRRLDEPDFELTKPSTGQAYNDTTNNQRKEKETKLGLPANDTSPSDAKL